MLARGRRTQVATLLRRALLGFLVASLLLPAFLPSVRADLPVVTTNANATQTVTWSMNSVAGLTATNVTFGVGQASLSWQPQFLSWSRTEDFTSNGTLDANLSAGGTGLALTSNETNRLSDGGFATPGPWSFVNGTTGNVTAGWAASSQAGQVRSVANATQSMWDSMDTQLNWTTTASTGIFAANLEESGWQKQGSGLQAIDVSSGWSSGGWVALQRNPSLGSVDWSKVNRLTLWFKMNSTLNAKFVLSAQAGGVVLFTPEYPLVQGWQLITVDLDALGTSSQRSSLTGILLEINGTSIPNNTWFSFDAVQTGNAKVFNETATISQSFHKADASSALPGSAYLSFDWVLENATGVTSYSPSVTVGNLSAALAGPTGAWQAFAADVSPYVTNAGTYTVGFHLRVAENATVASNVTFLVDNASFVYPDRHNGSYVSVPLTFGGASQYVSIDWSGSAVASTQIEVTACSGNGTAPANVTWSSCQSTFSPGSYTLFLAGAEYFRMAAYLSTTNASRTPVLASFSLEIQSHASEGSLASEVFDAPSSGFLGWQSLTVNAAAPAATSLRVYVGDGTYWSPVPNPANLSSSFSGTRFAWEIQLNTTDRLETPVVFSVSAVFAFLGAPSHLRITPDTNLTVGTGESIAFHAAALDNGGHVNWSLPITWSTTDRTGRMEQNGSQNATYWAGTPGWCNVTAVVQGLGVSETVAVYVTGSLPPSPSFFSQAAPYLAVVALAVLATYLVVTLVFRSRFAMDDVFLISHDGRLMSHNTRRILADRDEDILTGMWTAINSFVRDSDREENSHVRRFEYGGKTALVERGEHIFLAAVYSGYVPGWAAKDLKAFVRDLEEHFGLEFENWDGSPEDLKSLRDVMRRYVSRMRYNRRRVWNGLANGRSNAS